MPESKPLRRARKTAPLLRERTRRFTRRQQRLHDYATRQETLAG